MKEKQKKEIINFYHILGVLPNATLEQINKAFRVLSLKHHPDKPSAKEKGASDLYKSIVEAHDVLKNSEKRANYDRLLARSQENKIPASQISGLLTTHILPLSANYKEIHSKMIAQTGVELKIRESAIDYIPVIPEQETIDFFIGLKTRLESKEENEIPPFKESLTPSYAFGLFDDFLKGKYYGRNYICLKDYFKSALRSIERTQYNTLTVELYEGFLGLIEIVDQNDKRKDIYACVNKIIRYAREKEPTTTIKPIEKLAELFQNSIFRALYSAGMQQQWQTPVDIDINLFFESQLDEVLESDTDGLKQPYLHTLYTAQEDLYKKHQSLKQAAGGALGAPEWRTLAFYCLDYFPVISGHKQVTINQLLQVCLFLKKASKLEQNPKVQFADECLIIQTCLSIIKSAEHDKLYIDSYALHHSLCLLSTLNFEHPEVENIIGYLKFRMFKIIGFFPNSEELHSNLDMIHAASKQTHYVSDYLSTLVRWTKDKKKDLAFKRTTILNAAYEASLNGILPSDEQREKKLRRKLMEAFLAEKDASFVDISKNIHSDWVMVNMDNQGWLQPHLPLPFAHSLKPYQSLDGVEIDFAKGTVRLALKPFTSHDPMHTQVLTECDWRQIFKLGSSRIYFSLDPLSPDYRHHPFQQMVYGPPSIRDTEFFSTLFFTDYLLKFFTTGYEVQGQYPYEVRSVRGLIEKLPKSLQDSITHFQNQEKPSKVHRFWIEASTLPCFKEENDSMVRWSFGDIRMVIKKRGMKFNASGHLIDPKEEEEGWPIYVLNKLEDFDKEVLIKQPDFKALVFIKNSDHVYYFDDQVEHRHPIQVVLPLELKQELFAQTFDKQGLLLTGKEKAAYDNSHFIYQLTTFVCKQINKPTHFSPERILAAELTENYEALAQCFPEFERLKQLSRILGAATEMAQYFHRNEQSLKQLQDKYNDQSFWSTEETRLYQSLYQDKQTDFRELYKNIETAYSADVSMELKKLQEIRADMGSFTFTANSCEVTQTCNDLYRKLEENIKVQYGNAAWNPSEAWTQAIEPRISEIVQQYNEVGAQKKANYRQQIVNLFPEISQYLGTVEFNHRVNQFMDSNVAPLANAIAENRKQCGIQHLKVELCAAFPGVESEVTAALSGNGDALAKAVAQRITNRVISDSKTKLQESISTQLKLQAQFKSLGFCVPEKSTQKPPLTWIPSSVCHSVGAEHARLVYGGVLVQPTLSCKLDVDRHSMKLQMPSSSAFSKELDIKDAEGFVRDLRSGINRFGSQVNTGEISRMADDLDRKIQAAHSEAARQRSTATNLEPNYGFRHRGLDELPVYKILAEGLTGEASYKTFKSDSFQCAINKSEINELYKQVYNSSDPTEVPRIGRYLSRLETLVEEIKNTCKPATEEDLREMSLDEKSFLHMTPQDVRTYVLNQFEKSRGKDKSTDQKTQAPSGGVPSSVDYPDVFYRMGRGGS